MKERNKKPLTSDLSEEEKIKKLHNQIRGKMSKIRGMSNEDRSVNYVLSNYKKYGIVDKHHIYVTPRGSRHHQDLFSTEYGDKNEKAGFDLICIPENDNYTFIDGNGYSNRHSFHIYLIQVKSSKLPPAKYIEALQNFKVPTWVKKELHIWVGDELQIIPL